MEIKELLGQTLTNVEQIGDVALRFTSESGVNYEMDHYQDCCEDVRIEDIEGNLDDLVGTPILQAEESTDENGIRGSETCTWTFYKLATNKGYVTIRWLGESNGYYSESVDFHVLGER